MPCRGVVSQMNLHALDSFEGGRHAHGEFWLKPPDVRLQTLANWCFDLGHGLPALNRGGADAAPASQGRQLR